MAGQVGLRGVRAELRPEWQQRHLEVLEELSGQFTEHPACALTCKSLAASQAQGISGPGQTPLPCASSSTLPVWGRSPFHLLA